MSPVLSLILMPMGYADIFVSYGSRILVDFGTK